MPTTRRSTGSTRAQAGAPRCQTTLSFAHRVTKPGVRDPSKKAAAALPISKKSVSPSRDAKPSLTADEEVPLDRRPDEEAATTPEALVVEKSEAQVKAEAITEAQVSRYWKAIEKKRIAERVHQDDLGLEEKILRYFDVSSQYGPCTGISRLRRWERANGLGLSPPTEVLAVLMRGLSRGDDRATVAYMDEILGFRALGQLENTAE